MREVDYIRRKRRHESFIYFLLTLFSSGRFPTFAWIRSHPQSIVGMPGKPACAEVVFSSDVRNMDEWAKRTGIPLTTAESLGATYARSHPWLNALKTKLVVQH
jgi:hypothetical protein